MRMMDPVAQALRSGLRISILRWFLSEPARESYPSELSAVLGKSHQSIGRELAWLAEHGFLTVLVLGRMRRFRLAPDAGDLRRVAQALAVASPALGATRSAGQTADRP